MVNFHGDFCWKTKRRRRLPPGQLHTIAPSPAGRANTRMTLGAVRLKSEVVENSPLANRLLEE